MLKNEIKNILWGGGEKVIQLALSLIFIGLISRYFGIDLYGIYQYALSFLLIATSLTWVCSSDILYLSIDKNGNLEQSKINSSLILRLLIGLCVFTVSIFYAFINIQDETKLYFVLVLLVTVIYSEPLGIFRFLLETTGHYHLTSKIRILSAGIKLILVYFIIFFRLSFYYILLAILIESVLTLSLAIYFYKKNYNYSINLKYLNPNFLLDLIRSGLYYWPGLVAMSVFYRLDRLILQEKFTSFEFGAYAAAISLLDQVTGVGLTIVAILAPILVYKNNEHIHSKKIFSLIISFAAIGFTFACFLYYLSPKIIYIIYGNKFDKSIEIFKYAIFMVILIYPDLILSSILLKKKCYKFFVIKWTFVLFADYYLLENSKNWSDGVNSTYIGWAIALFISIIYIFLNEKIQHYSNRFFKL